MSQQAPNKESNNDFEENSIIDDNEENITVIDNDEAVGAKKRTNHSHKSSSSHHSHHSSSHSHGSGHSHSLEHEHHSHKHISKNKREKITFSVDSSDQNIPVPHYRKIKSEAPKEPKEVKAEKPKKERSKAFKIFVGIGVTIMSLLIVMTSTLFILIQSGKNSMHNDETVAQNLVLPNSVVAEDDYIVYNGEKYKFNQDVTTILFAGIDTRSEEDQLGTLGTAGQADAIFVMSVNTNTGESKIMAVSRDSMVDVNVCDAAGNFLGTEELQICLAHAYGDGAESSSENLKRSVSRLFFGIPVNAYLTLDLDAISILNDTVGGVTVEVVEDLTHKDEALKLGETVTLTGSQAETYVRYRDVQGDENQNNLRMERQKSYLESFIQKTIDMTKQDITTPVTLVNAVEGYSQTDLTADKITYLASLFINTGFSTEEDMIKIPGETVMGETYAEYIVDTDALFEIILDTYYTKITE